MAISPTVKESVILKALNRKPGVTIKSVAKANNIGISTLGKWLAHRRKINPTSSATSAPQEHWLNHLLNTKGMDDVSLGAYCRKHGIYSHQLTDWKNTLMSPKAHDKAENQALKKLKEENKKLQREIARKDKALAEASALLILKKKADLIWGVDEDAS